MILLHLLYAIGVFLAIGFLEGLLWVGLITFARQCDPRRVNMELPVTGQIHFRDGPVVVINAATPAAAIDRLITDGRRRTEYRGVWE